MHQKEHPRETELDARIQNYELAARMQLAAAEVLDLSKETPATRKMYGLDNPVTAPYGTRCLMARRLIEAGVRFVQIFPPVKVWEDRRAGIIIRDQARLAVDVRHVRPGFWSAH